MAFGQGAGAFGVALGDGLEDGAVFAVGAFHIARGVEVGAPEQVQFLDVVVVGLVRTLVAAEVQDHGVEPQVELVVERAVPRLAGGVHAVQQLFEFVAVGVVHMRAGALGREAEDQGAQLIDFQHLANRDLAHEDAAVGHGRHQSQAGQHADGFTDGTAAGAHAQGQGGFVEPFAGLDVAAVDQALEFFRDGWGQALFGFFFGGGHGAGGRSEVVCG